MDLNANASSRRGNSAPTDSEHRRFEPTPDWESASPHLFSRKISSKTSCRCPRSNARLRTRPRRGNLLSFRDAAGHMACAILHPRRKGGTRNGKRECRHPLSAWLSLLTLTGGTTNGSWTLARGCPPQRPRYPQRSKCRLRRRTQAAERGGVASAARACPAPRRRPQHV